MMKGNNSPDTNQTPTIGDMLERIKDISLKLKQYPSGSPRRKYLEEEQSKIIDQFDGVPDIQSQCKKLIGDIRTQIHDKPQTKKIQSQTSTTELDNIFSRMIELQQQIKQSSGNKNEIEFLNAEYSNLMDFVDNISDYPKLSGENEISSKGE
jgi:hypothetical protein